MLQELNNDISYEQNIFHMKILNGGVFKLDVFIIHINDLKFATAPLNFANE